MQATTGNCPALPRQVSVEGKLCFVSFYEQCGVSLLQQLTTDSHPQLSDHFAASSLGLRHPTPPAWHYLVLCLVHPILKYLPDSCFPNEYKPNFECKNNKFNTSPLGHDKHIFIAPQSNSHEHQIQGFSCALTVVCAGIPVYHSLHLISASAVDLFRQGPPDVKNTARIQA